ncbi:hypothetical protein [Sporolactobacillus laevolacticus]|uniref:hypothetical protein n=1 Tax=Sporolactobacillus laevolacticus TaxID=33018 RepID=UPI000423CA33|nr:hypothetical protein [Sporolactobacillus laevolacticus]
MLKGVNNKSNWLELLAKSILSFIGVAILALGATLCKQGHIGLDPFTALNIGVSKKIHLSLGIYQLLVNVFIIIFVILLDRKKIGIGTIINMVFAGFMIDWFSSFYSAIFHYHPTLLTGMVNGILGLLFLLWALHYTCPLILGSLHMTQLRRSHLIDYISDINFVELFKILAL